MDPSALVNLKKKNYVLMRGRKASMLDTALYKWRIIETVKHIVDAYMLSVSRLFRNEE